MVKFENLDLGQASSMKSRTHGHALACTLSHAHLKKMGFWDYMKIPTSAAVNVKLL